jgi:hypothetical protein
VNIARPLRVVHPTFRPWCSYFLSGVGRYMVLAVWTSGVGTSGVEAVALRIYPVQASRGIII